MEFLTQTNDPNYLHTTAKRLTHPFTAFNELTDNAIDAAATLITITGFNAAGAHRLRITDDGSGCSPAGLHAMMSFGNSEKRKGKIGKYGEGHKTAVMHLGPVTFLLLINRILNALAAVTCFFRTHSCSVKPQRTVVVRVQRGF